MGTSYHTSAPFIHGCWLRAKDEISCDIIYGLLVIIPVQGYDETRHPTAQGQLHSALGRSYFRSRTAFLVTKAKVN